MSKSPNRTGTTVVSADRSVLGSGASAGPTPPLIEDAQLKAVLEAIVYVTEEPLSADTDCRPRSASRAERVEKLLEHLVAEFDRPEHGVTIREVAGGYKMATKAEHHEARPRLRQEPASRR